MTAQTFVNREPLNNRQTVAAIRARQLRLNTIRHVRAGALERSLELRAEFMLLATHELSGSLSAMRLAAELASSSNVTEEQRNTLLATIRKECQHSEVLLNDLTRASLDERCEFHVELESIPAKSIVSDALGFVAVIAAERTIQSLVQSNALVLADPARIAQVCKNLLTNAIKYGVPSQAIEINAVDVDGGVRFEVVNRSIQSGPLPCANRFERCVRGSISSPNIEPGRRGLGVGLHITRLLLIAQGSNLEFEQFPDDRIAFSFALRCVQ